MRRDSKRQGMYHLVVAGSESYLGRPLTRSATRVSLVPPLLSAIRNRTRSPSGKRGPNAIPSKLEFESPQVFSQSRVFLTGVYERPARPEARSPFDTSVAPSMSI